MNSFFNFFPDFTPPPSPPPSPPPVSYAQYENEVNQAQSYQQQAAQAESAQQQAQAQAQSYQQQAAQAEYAQQQAQAQVAQEASVASSAQAALQTEKTQYVDEVQAYLSEQRAKQALQTKYNAEKVADLLEISKEHAEKLLATDLAKRIIHTDTILDETEKHLKLKTAQNMVLHEQLKKKRQENREMLHKISMQDDELAKIETELEQCILKQKKPVPTRGPFTMGQVTRPEKSLTFNATTHYVTK